MPGKRKPPPVFVARTNNAYKTNFGITEDGTVYIIEMRGGYCAGHEHPPREATRKLPSQNGARANLHRERLRALIDLHNPQA